MRNGSRDEYYLLFTSAGAILKGFDHESIMSPWRSGKSAVGPGVLDRVPEEFAGFLSEPAFNLKDATFCIWRTAADSVWHRGPVVFLDGDGPDGTAGLLWLSRRESCNLCRVRPRILQKSPALGATAHIFEHKPLTLEIVEKLDRKKDSEEAVRDAAEIGYAEA